MKLMESLRSVATPGYVHRSCGRNWAAVLGLMLAVTTGATLAQVSSRNADIGYPHFSGQAHPVPDTGVQFTPGGFLGKVYARDQAQGAGSAPGNDFWIDRMLARVGTAGGHGDDNNWLFTRGRAAYLYTHQPDQPGFVGDVAYWHKTGHDALFRLQLAQDGKLLQLSEVPALRRQTPSYFTTVFEDAAAGVRLQLLKFITYDNVAVAEATLSALDGKAHVLDFKVVSPMATHAEGSELTGAFQARNNITTVFARLSADGFTPQQGELVRRVQVPAAASTQSYKVQLGLTTRELPSSLAEYQRIASQSSQQAYRTHVAAYNRWWVDNVPYLDTPEDNIDKTLFYRWWLLRFNFLDAAVPGNDYQFPVAIEGVLGYDNAIVLTTCMFLDDLKYLRDPSYAYGSWIGAGEVAGGGKYVDNPGSPENWSNSYAQYLTAAAWRSYQLHGGPVALAGKLAAYGRGDVLGLIKAYDSNGNGLIEYDWAAMTGNDADAVSFDWARQHGQVRMDRTESAYVWANAKAAAEAARLSGDTRSAQQMEQVAAKIRNSLLQVLWNDASDEADSMGLKGGLLKHRQASASKLAVDWKETNNYFPFTVGMMPKQGDADYDRKYVQALRLFADAGQYPIFPFYTANQADKHARGEQGSNNFSVINSTVMFRMLASVLRQYPSPYLDTQWYRKLLYWNAWAHYIDGDNRYPDQNEFWAQGSAGSGGAIGYRSWIHHTQLGATNFTIIEDVMGLRPRSDDKIELYPIDIGWDHFAADGLRYRNRDLSIVWDKDASHYAGKVPKGYSVYLDGRRVFTVDRLAHVLYDPTSGQVEVLEDVLNHGPAVQVLHSERSTLQRPEQVTVGSGSRLATVLADAGIDTTLPAAASVNLALGARVSASYATPGFAAEAAVDGSTANEPFWGTAGSPNASDWLELDLGKPQVVDDVRLYFYRSSAPAGEQHGYPSGTRSGYAPPWLYRLQYLQGNHWKQVPGQVREQLIAQGNRNRVRFPPIRVQRLRLQLSHAGAMRSGLKEIQLYASGRPARPAAVNLPPQVQAWLEDRMTGSAALQLAAKVGDDALPDAQLTLRWRMLQGPPGGEAIFADPSTTDTSVRFTRTGQYRLRLQADDGAATAHADVVVEAPPQAAGQGLQIQGEAQASAQYTASHHRLQALNDGYLPAPGSRPPADHRWGSWGRAQPASVWLQYQWQQPQRISGSRLYFWDDQPGGGVATPSGWKLQYLQQDQWRDIQADYALPGAGKPGDVSFAAVTTTALRVVLDTAADAQGHKAVGVDEWQVFAEQPERVEPLELRTDVGQMPQLPSQLQAWYADGSSAPLPVRWPALEADKLEHEGRIELHGLAEGGMAVTATLWLRATQPGQLNTVDVPADVHIRPGQTAQLPEYAIVQYNDGSRERRPVQWQAEPGGGYAHPGQYYRQGQVSGRANTGTQTVRLRVIVAGTERQP